MNSPANRIQQRKNMCDGKKPYPDITKARTAAKIKNATRMKGENPWNHYRCKFCLSYHIGHFKPVKA